jgi:Beta-lactamase/Domain of unknown function (DUF3471)
VASPHAPIKGRQVPIRRERQRESTAPSGSVQSSMRDMTRWMRLHLDNGVLDGRRYVSDSTMREMHSIQTPIGTTPQMRASRLVQDSVVGYGLGWQIMDYRGHPLLWHTGNGRGQIAFMSLLPRDRLGVVVVVNTWSAPFVHAALMNRIIDTYLGYPPRDWAAEALARVPGIVAAEDSARNAAHGTATAGSPPRPLTSYGGRYDEPLFGPVFVRAEPSGLVLQMGQGQIADLVLHHGDSFMVHWRDPVYQEVYNTILTFQVEGDVVKSLRVRINRDEFTATRGL